MSAFLDNLGVLLFYLTLAAVLFALACGLEWLLLRWHERGRKPRPSMRDWK